MEANELPEDIFSAIQEVFRKAPVLLIGSGFSCGYGLPGMGELAKHLATSVPNMLTTDGAKAIWVKSINAIKDNLEKGLNGIATGSSEWGEIVSAIRKETAKLILERTASAEESILRGGSDVDYSPSRLLRRLFDGSPQNSNGIHIITTNYDTLLELFCDLEGLPLDTGFSGFRRRKPRVSTNGIFEKTYTRELVTQRGKGLYEHRPCKSVRLYKPHGSISWLETDEGPVEVLNDLLTEKRAIVVPGPSKYRDSMVNKLFDDIRAEMNDVISKSSALVCIGFGFNDDHLQGEIQRRVEDGMPVVILALGTTPNIEKLLEKNGAIIAVFASGAGSVCRWNGRVWRSNEPLWRLGDFMKKFLE